MLCRDAIERVATGRPAGEADARVVTRLLHCMRQMAVSHTQAAGNGECKFYYTFFVLTSTGFRPRVAESSSA
jgi:hypothetical protein